LCPTAGLDRYGRAPAGDQLRGSPFQIRTQERRSEGVGDFDIAHATQLQTAPLLDNVTIGIRDVQVVHERVPGGVPFAGMREQGSGIRQEPSHDALDADGQQQGLRDARLYRVDSGIARAGVSQQ
jgi:hypothetical protein